MSVIAFPSTLTVSKMTWGQHRNDLLFRSPFGSQSVSISQPVWKVSIEAPVMTDSEAGAWKAWVMQLRGGTNTASMWDMQRPQPLGTLTQSLSSGQSSLSFGAAVAAGDTTLTIHSGMRGAGKTLLAGDLIGFGSSTTQQVVMNTADVTIDSEMRNLLLDFVNQSYSSGYAGEFTVTVEPPVRNAFASGTALAWDKPSALFRLQTTDPSWDYVAGKLVSGFALDFIEDWR